MHLDRARQEEALRAPCDQVWRAIIRAIVRESRFRPCHTLVGLFNDHAYVGYYDVRALPAMVHGTKFFNMRGILDKGLNAARAFCILNMIPHYDERAGLGQRFDD